MKQTLSVDDVANALRADEYAGWSYYGAQALAEFLEQYEDDTGTDMELDVVAIRCDFSEYESATAYCLEHFGPDKGLEDLDLDWLDAEQAEDEDLVEEKALEWIQEHTTAIPFNHNNPFMEGRTSGVVIQDF